MTRPTKTDSAQAFSGLAETYSRARPQYPDLLWSTLRERLDHHPVPHSAVDFGSGTGIAKRQLARALPGWRAAGVEPGEAMRAAAVRDSSDTAIEFRFGTTPQANWISPT